MGFWIYLHAVLSNNDGEITLSEEYVWEGKRSCSSTKQLCPVHFLDTSCPRYSKCIHCIRRFQTDKPPPCTLIDIWGIEEDCIGRCGADVAHRAGKALNILKKLGIIPRDIFYTLNKEYPSYTDRSSLDYWMSVADEIYEFRQLGRKYPDHYFMRSDGYYDIIPFESGSDSEYSSELESDDESSTGDD